MATSTAGMSLFGSGVAARGPRTGPPPAEDVKPYDRRWQTTLDHGAHESAHHVFDGPGDDVIVGGKAFVDGTQTGYVKRVGADGSGTVAWSRSLAAPDGVSIRGMAVTDDGVFVTGVITESPGSTGFLQSLSFDGGRNWEHRFDAGRTSSGYDIVATGDGSYWWVGTVDGFGGADGAVCVPFEADGTLHDHRMYRAPSADPTLRYGVPSGQGRLLGVASGKNETGEQVAVVVGIGRDGARQFRTRLGTNKEPFVRDAAATSQGGVAVVGTDSGSGYDSETFVAAVTGDGREAWLTRDTSPSRHYYGITSAPDGSLVLAGWMPQGSDAGEAMVARVNRFNQFDWRASYGPASFRRARDLFVRPNGDVVFCGNAESDQYTNSSVLGLQNRQPVISVSSWPANPRVGETVTFDGGRSYDPEFGHEPLSWQFDTDDDSEQSGPRAKMAFDSGGNHTVRVTMRDTAGVETTKEINVEVSPPTGTSTPARTPTPAPTDRPTTTPTAADSPPAIDATEAPRTDTSVAGFGLSAALLGTAGALAARLRRGPDEE